MKPSLSGAALVEALKSGGYVILMRHQATEPVAPDPAFFDIADCETQRNLSEEGRRQLGAVAKVVRQRGIGIGDVMTSPYSRPASRLAPAAAMAFARYVAKTFNAFSKRSSGHSTPLTVYMTCCIAWAIPA